MKPAPNPPTEPRIPVIEEDLQVGRERVETGTLRVQVHPEAVTVPVDLEGWRESADVERVPCGREVDEVLAPWREGDVLVVPVYEERVVLQRRLVLKEELRVRLRREPQAQTVEVPLRRDRVEISRQAPGDGGDDDAARLAPAPSCGPARS